jgi:hypothetical protein
LKRWNRDYFIALWTSNLADRGVSTRAVEMGSEDRRGQMDDEIMSDFSNCRFDTDKIPSVLGSVYSISTDCPLPSASGATPVRRSPGNPPHLSFSTPNGSFYVTVPGDSLHPIQLNSMAGPPQPTGDCRFVTISATLADASVRKESDGITCTTFDIFREPALYAVLLHWTESFTCSSFDCQLTSRG